MKQLLENQYLVITQGCRLILSLFIWNYMAIHSAFCCLASHQQIVSDESSSRFALSARQAASISLLETRESNGKIMLRQIFPIMAVVITVFVNMMLLRGAVLAPTDCWMQNSTTQVSQPDDMHYQSYPISMIQVSLCPSGGLRSAVLGHVYIHANLRGLCIGSGGSFEVGGWNRTNLCTCVQG